MKDFNNFGLGCKDLEKMAENPDLDLKLDLDLAESKHDHERGQYLTDFDDFGVVEEMRVRVFQRHQNHQNPLSIDTVQGLVLIWIQVQVHIFSGPCNQGFFDGVSGLKEEFVQK